MPKSPSLTINPLNTSRGANSAVLIGKRRKLAKLEEDDFYSTPAPVTVIMRDGVRLPVPEILYPQKSRDVGSRPWRYRSGDRNGDE